MRWPLSGREELVGCLVFVLLGACSDQPEANQPVAIPPSAATTTPSATLPPPPPAATPVPFVRSGDWWARAFQSTSTSVAAPTVVVAPDGNIVAGVTIGVHGAAETADLGGGLLQSAGQYGMVVGKFTPDGDHIWSRQFSSPDWSGFSDLTVSEEGEVVIAGTFRDTIDVGGGQLVSAGKHDIFIVQLDSGGQHIWSRSFGAEGRDVAGDIAFTAEGELILAGSFDAAVDLGTGPIVPADDYDAFVARLDADGSTLWVRQFGAGGPDRPRDLVVDPETGAITLAASLAWHNDPYEPEAEMLLAGIAPDGDLLWSHEFTGEGAQYVHALALDHIGNIVVAGIFDGPFSLGGSELVPNGWGHDYLPVAFDAFVATFNPAGEHLWSTRYGDPNDEDVSGLTIDLNGDILVSGDFHLALELGGNVEPVWAGEQGRSGYIARFNPSGTPVAVAVLDDARQVRPVATTEQSGAVVISGRFLQRLALVAGTLRTPNYNDAFIARVEAP